MAVSRVVLIGFMGAGKTSVGRELARRLGWRFVDLDEAVEEREGRSVSEIFHDSGEPTFRRLEEQLGREVLEAERLVVATGGGWAVTEGRLEALPEGTLSVWLDVSPDEAVGRAGAEAGTRPLLAVSDALAEAAELVAVRRPYYAKADVRVDTDVHSVDDVTTRIMEILEELESENRR